METVASISEFLDGVVGRYGPRLAIQYRPRYRTLRWSYLELGTHAAKLTSLLDRHSVGCGDRVFLFAENSPHWVAAFFAIAARGAVVVPLNPRSPPEQLANLVRSAGPSLVLASPRCHWESAPLPVADIERLGTVPTDRPAAPTGPAQLAEIIYTSGTTGDPKGVMLTHANLLSDLSAVARAVPLAPDDHVLSLVPLFHVYGQMTSLFCPLAAGCPVSYLTAPTTRSVLDALAHTPATHLVAVPEVLKTMLDRLEARLGGIPVFLRPLLRGRIRAQISKSLRTLVCGGAPLDPIVEEKWWALGFEVLQGYGLTETSPVIAANTPQAHRIGSVGKPLAEVELRIAPDGEILVKGPMVMAGYFGDPARTEAAFTDGWLKTDDVGRLDADGFLYVYGRKRYMILGPGGENVFPEDIEAVLNRTAGVTDCAVVGLESGGRTLIHAVLLADEARAAGIVAEANRHLAPHQRIVSWSVWPDADFPRAVTRKVKKDEVLRRLRREPSAQAGPAGRTTPLRLLLAQVAGTEASALSDDTRLIPDLGLDSLLRIELVARIEEDLGVCLDETDVGPQTTVADLEALLVNRRGRMPQLAAYPRWSLSPLASKLRPLAQKIFLQWWIAPFCRLRISGWEHLAALEGPVIFMANHRSYLDSAIATFALPERFRYRLAIAAATGVLYTRYRWAVPVGELALNAFPLPSEPDENIRPGLELVGHLLDDGWNVLIFPEGQMNRSGLGIQPLRRGAGTIAVDMGVPVVPMVIEGTERVMPPGKIVPRAVAPVSVRFGAPLRGGETEPYGRMLTRIEEALRRLLQNPSP
ncbi:MULTISPECIES: AMP-binding protein [Methylococcus]|uniref:AMP-binding protein n=1 Tax=Methylococcus capsulatus TaxID=414 RepID=A0ABZ2F3A3_METCP|nr:MULTISPECIES: AMP-binding protein [Methylococcus]MDF9392177.1 acyltransferase [Methylococcus capsulatus]